MKPLRPAVSILVLSSMGLSGCHRRPIVAVVPIPPPVPVEMVSVPTINHPSEPLPKLDLEAPSALTLELPRYRLPRYRPGPIAPGALAALIPPEAPMDLGQLTTGGESGNSTLRQETQELLQVQQKRLTTIPHTLIATHSAQVQQARFFLRAAADAWKKLDVEGARTLAVKAKVLLDEIQG